MTRIFTLLLLLLVFCLCPACGGDGDGGSDADADTDTDSDTDTDTNTDSGGDTESTPDPGPPNVVVYVSDDIRAVHLNTYGGVGVPTPALDTLANEGMRFTQAHAGASMCTPSRFAILTGTHTSRCTHANCLSAPVGQPYSVQWDGMIEDPVKTIAHYMKEGGYHTGFVGKWHTGDFLTQMNIPFLAPNADPEDPDVDAALAARHQVFVNAIKEDAGFDYAGSVLWKNFPDFPITSMRHHHFEWMTRGAMNFFDTAPDDKPFFLYLATTAVHGPDHAATLSADAKYTPQGIIDDGFPESPTREEVRQRVLDSAAPFDHLSVGLTMQDDQVKVLMDKLEAMGEAENTIFIYLADHGTEPGKASAYEQGVHIPMIIKWPSEIEAGSVSQSLVQTVDLVPTILDAAGVEATTDPLDGESFRDVLAGVENTATRYLYFEAGFTRAVSDGEFKYIAYRIPPYNANLLALPENAGELAPNHLMMDDQEQPYMTLQSYPGYFDPDQLYELAADPYEQNNLAGDPAYADKLAEMKEALRVWLADIETSHPNNPFPLDDPDVISYMTSDQYDAQVALRRVQADQYLADSISWWSGGWPDCANPNFCDIP